jgi:hypothetical protein
MKGKKHSDKVDVPGYAVHEPLDPGMEDRQERTDGKQPGKGISKQDPTASGPGFYQRVNKVEQQRGHHGRAYQRKIKPKSFSRKIRHKNAEVPDDRSDAKKKKRDVECGPRGTRQHEDDEDGVDHHRCECEVYVNRLKSLFHGIKNDVQQISTGC